ncbi:hypothetical protein ACWZEH_00745 [Streptomyces sp. QTS137]
MTRMTGCGTTGAHAWNATHDVLAAPHCHGATSLRRLLLRLSVRLWWHP